MYIIIAQIIRVFGSIIGLISDKATDPKKIYFYNGIFNILCAILYFLLNAITGAITSILAIFRNILFYKYGKKLPLMVLIIYLLITTILNLTVYEGIVSLIPIVLVTIYTIGLYLNNIKKFKICCIIVNILEIFYDFFYSAYVGIFFCIVAIILLIISLNKIKKRKRKRLKK